MALIKIKAILFESAHIYYSEVSEKISDGGGTDTHEFIEIVEMDLDEVMDFDFRDMKTELALNKVFRKINL